MAIALNHSDTPPAPQKIETPPAASIHRNTLSTQFIDGRWMIVKRRTRIGRVIAGMANLYFRAAGIALRFWTDPKDWQRWEARWFCRLNKNAECSTPASAEIRQERLTGNSLWEHLQHRTLTEKMIAAAGREYRRAHSMHSDYYGGGWSHGDASMSNVIYDEASDQAHLIDFEIVHDRTLPAEVRQADDLLVFLLDLAGFAPRRRWMTWALGFLRAYGHKDPIAELQKVLQPPRGIARIWWKVRTNFKPSMRIRRRLQKLHRSLSRGAV